MTNKIKYTGRKLLSKLLNIIFKDQSSVNFQACFGTPKDLNSDTLICGVVKSKKNNKPIQGIKVSLDNHPQFEISDQNGKFSFYAPQISDYNFTLYCLKTKAINKIEIKNKVYNKKSTIYPIELFIDLKNIC